ncbi:MAG: Rrf2 family transcriptional regulator [Actinomycetota bacterium]|nr:Rrf2 family transcriptional regulator [Actinomycetota bacterium]
MKFSVKTEYGLRAMIELALRNGDGLIGAREIAARQQIPERFLEQQITALKRAGLVISQRGSSGGCSLARGADEITVLEVIEALDGLVIDMDCINNKIHSCSQVAQCVIQEVWQGSQVKLREYLGSVTISDLVKRQEQLKDGARVKS